MSSILLTANKLALASKDLAFHLGSANLNVKKGCKIRIREDLGIRCKDDYASQIINEFWRKVVADVVEGYTVNILKDASVVMFPKAYGMDMIEKSTQFGRLQDLDFLKTNFKVYAPEIQIRHNNGSKTKILIRFGKEYNERITKVNNEGFKLKGIKTINDCMSELYNEKYTHLEKRGFKIVLISSMKRIVSAMKNGVYLNFSNNHIGNLMFLPMTPADKGMLMYRKYRYRIEHGICKYDGYFYFTKNSKALFRSKKHLQARHSLKEDVFRIYIGNCAGDNIMIKKGIYDTTDAELVHKGITVGLQSNGSSADYIDALQKRRRNNK